MALQLRPLDRGDRYWPRRDGPTRLDPAPERVDVLLIGGRQCAALCSACGGCGRLREVIQALDRDTAGPAAEHEDDLADRIILAVDPDAVVIGRDRVEQLDDLGVAGHEENVTVRHTGQRLPT